MWMIDRVSFILDKSHALYYEVKLNKAADLEKSEMSTNFAHGCKTLIVLYHMPREKEMGGGSNNICKKGFIL